MPRLMRANKFGVITYTLMLAAGILWFASTWAIDEFVPVGALQKISRFMAFVLFAVLGIKIFLNRLKGFSCPKCRSSLSSKANTDRPKANQEDNVSKYAILFYCNKCDILWDSCVRGNSD